MISRIKNYFKYKNLICSVHIPKCGGTSFRQSLLQEYDSALFTEYGTPREQKQNKKKINTSHKCIHGHLVFRAYKDILDNSKKITFMRDPVSRTISLYYDIKTHDRLGVLSKFVYDNNPSLVDFAEHPMAVNYGIQCIGHYNPDQFLFIGILEKYDYSLKRCSKLLNWNSKPKKYNLNCSNILNINTLNKKVYDHIKKLNKEEFEWYEYAKKILK